MQQPSWVRSPFSYDIGSVSSLSVAFEDPDGGKLRALLAKHYLYIFGTRALVKKWKQRQNKNKGESKDQADQQFQGSEDSSDEENIKITLTPKPANPLANPLVTPIRIQALTANLFKLQC
jgi:hypothetical protein